MTTDELLASIDEHLTSITQTLQKFAAEVDPKPKPEVGQHWLSETGREYVVITRDHFGSTEFWPIRNYEQLPVTAAVAPDGWTLK